MPFLRSSTRPQAVECFFCLSPSVLPPQVSTSTTGFIDRKGKGRDIPEVGSKWNWQCKRCGCWNIRNERGEMKSDHPAMHDPALNARSFALRATPSTSHLPSTSSSTMFCHSCLANQTLIMNMLANYLPDDDDPTYPELYAGLPSYLSSLHARYPPVCASCQPAVDDALRKADQKAQGEAWGSALRRGRDSRAREERGMSKIEVLMWKLRGVGFWGSATLIWVMEAIAATVPRTWSSHAQLMMLLARVWLGVAMASVLWLAWDPLWLRRRRERLCGRVKGRQTWMRNMLFLLVLRILCAAGVVYLGQSVVGARWFIGSSLITDISLFIHAFSAIRTPRPVSLRLVRPTQFSVPSSPNPTSSAASNMYPYVNPDLMSDLTLNQLQPKHHPVFGKTSLSPRPSYSQLRSDDMDWEPTPPPTLYNGGYTSQPSIPSAQEPSGASLGGEWDNFAVGKQRMFGRKEGEDETGLEGLLAGWGLAEPVRLTDGRGAGSGTGWTKGPMSWFRGGKMKGE